MELETIQSSERNAFRFFADFDIQVRPARIVGFSTRQLTLLQSVLRSPVIKRHLARMALETDLAGITGRHLTDLFRGPDLGEILDLVLHCLGPDEGQYWEALRFKGGDALHDELTPVFLAFDVTLRRSGMEELAEGTVEPILKMVGPTMDASSL